MASVVVVLNAGSSSLKFKLFEDCGDAEPRLVLQGAIEGVGGPARFAVRDTANNVLDEGVVAESAVSHEDALLHLVGWLTRHKDGHTLVAVGHRVVHGGDLYAGPVRVDDAVLSSLHALAPLAPLHQPHNLKPIEAIQRRMPDLPQIACFDTAFHRTQPEIAQMFALPRSFWDQGVKRYGFHGLSYQYIASALGQYEPRLVPGRVIVAHLGNGASLCALKQGQSIATTMGFSALDGVPMGTRCGAIDPAVIFHMLRSMKLGPEEAERVLYTQSGLLGVSGLSNDMRKLRANEATNACARQAIDLFIYRITREIGALMAILGGLDALIFTAGIGENDVATRAEIIANLGWTGLAVDAVANQAGRPLISMGTGPTAWIIPTNEELVIARQVRDVLRSAQSQSKHSGSVAAGGTT
jgi:acetate kinase